MPSSIHPTASSPIRERNPRADRSEQSGDPRAFHPGFGAKFTHTTSRRPPFLDDLLEWRHSPEGQQFAELADALCDLMEDMQLDAKQRKFIWPDGQRLGLDQSVAHVQEQYPDFRRDWIEEYLIDWIDMDYAPEHYSEAQLDELDKLTARWIADHKRRAKASKKHERTRHS